MVKLSLDVPVQRKAIAPRESVTLDLPFPPSVNNLFPTGRAGARFISPEYKKWRNDAGWLVLSRGLKRVPGPVKVTILLSERGKRLRVDCDNFCKAPLDLLVKHQVIDGDGRDVVRSVSAVWAGHDFDGIRVVIEQAEPMRSAA